MPGQKPLFKSPYDIRDVSALFAIVAFVLIIAAIVGNNLFGLFQENVNFGLIDYSWVYKSNTKNFFTSSSKVKSNYKTKV